MQLFIWLRVCVAMYLAMYMSSTRMVAPYSAVLMDCIRMMALCADVPRRRNLHSDKRSFSPYELYTAIVQLCNGTNKQTQTKTSKNSKKVDHKGGCYYRHPREQASFRLPNPCGTIPLYGPYGYTYIYIYISI